MWLAIHLHFYPNSAKQLCVRWLNTVFQGHYFKVQHQVHHHKQRFAKIATTGILDSRFDLHEV